MINKSLRYTNTAITLHWVMSILIFLTFGLGFYLSDLPISPDKIKLLNRHKMLGLTVLMLFVIRLIWRLINRPPELPQNILKINKILAHSVHGLLYLLMFAIPMSGILYSQASSFNVNWFGLFEVPRMISPDQNLAHTLKEVHKALNLGLLILLLAHLGAVIKHQLIDKDNILQRMTFSRKK